MWQNVQSERSLFLSSLAETNFAAEVERGKFESIVSQNPKNTAVR